MQLLGESLQDAARAAMCHSIDPRRRSAEKNRWAAATTKLATAAAAWKRIHSVLTVATATTITADDELIRLFAASPNGHEMQGCGCPCEPGGNDGLSCPRADGTLLCQDKAIAPPLPHSVEKLIAELRIIEGVRLAIGGTQEIADDYRERCSTFLHLNYAALVQALIVQRSEVDEDAARFRWFVLAMIEDDGAKRAALKAQRFPHDLDGYRRSIDAARAAQPEGRTDG